MLRNPHEIKLSPHPRKIFGDGDVGLVDNDFGVKAQFLQRISLHFGENFFGERGESRLAVEPVTRSGDDSSSFGPSISGVDARDPIGGLVEIRRGTSGLVQWSLAAFSGIDDDGDVVDRDARLGDVRGKDDLSVARRRSIVGLLERQRLELGMQADDGGFVVRLEIDNVGTVVESVTRLNDLVVSRQENENGAGGHVVIEDVLDQDGQQVDVHGFVVEASVVYAELLLRGFRKVVVVVIVVVVDDRGIVVEVRA